MLSAMFSAVSGLHANQLMMDVIGSNIANVNTVGYKSGRVNFEDILSQTIRGGTAPQGGFGSINPAQVGLGVIVAGIDVLHTQGNLQSTGRATDLAIQGDGFFVMGAGDRSYYTRDGAFDIALDGTLVNPASGLHVQGWQANNAGVVDKTGQLTDLTIPIGQRTTALTTSSGKIQGNLDATAAVGDTATTTVTAYDSMGVSHSVKVTFTKTAANTWGWAASVDASDTTASTTSTGTVTFDGAGQYTGATGSPLSIALTNGATSPQSVALDLSTMNQFGGASQVSGTTDGFTSGTLDSFAIGSGGEITGVYSNGQTVTIGQIAIAGFANPAGLLRAGQNLFAGSSASGQPLVGVPATAGHGSVTTGALEMSNVDLATQFTEMITAQRGFQANGRVITTSDQMLEELVNLKR